MAAPLDPKDLVILEEHTDSELWEVATAIAVFELYGEIGNVSMS